MSLVKCSLILQLQVMVHVWLGDALKEALMLWIFRTKYKRSGFVAKLVSNSQPLG